MVNLRSGIIGQKRIDMKISYKLMALIEKYTERHGREPDVIHVGLKALYELAEEWRPVLHFPAVPRNVRYACQIRFMGIPVKEHYSLPSDWLRVGCFCFSVNKGDS